MSYVINEKETKKEQKHNGWWTCVPSLATVLGCLSLFLSQALCACISACVCRVCVCGLHVKAGACLRVK